MKGRALRPILIYVVTHLFDKFRNKVCSGRLVLAALYFNAARPEHAGERADALERAAMKTQDGGGPELERTLRLQPVVDLLNDLVELTKSVLCFPPSSFLRV